MSKTNETDLRNLVISRTERDVANVQRDAALAENQRLQAALDAERARNAAPPAPPPAPTPEPEPAQPSIADTYKRLKASDPYLAAQFLLNNSGAIVEALESKRTK